MPNTAILPKEELNQNQIPMSRSQREPDMEKQIGQCTVRIYFPTNEDENNNNALVLSKKILAASYANRILKK
jgi:hypothetical protein